MDANRAPAVLVGWKSGTWLTFGRTAKTAAVARLKYDNTRKVSHFHLQVTVTYVVVVVID
jgi:hypothetical protein